MSHFIHSKSNDPEWVEEKNYFEIPNDQVVYFTPITHFPYQLTIQEDPF
jgi:hypothetical protein